MNCPRCNSPYVSKVGADLSGKRFQCRVCTNEWYDESPEVDEKLEALKGKPSAQEALQKVLAYCEERLEVCKLAAIHARDRGDANAYHEELGGQASAAIIADYIRAQIKGLG